MSATFLIFVFIVILFLVMFLVPKIKKTKNKLAANKVNVGALARELLIIAVCGYGINFFIENVLDIDYTANWEINNNDVAYADRNSKIIIVNQEQKDDYVKTITSQRHIDRFGFFAFYGFFLGGYFCAKAARNEIKRRGVIIPVDGTEYLDDYTIASNRRIVGMRFVSILMFMLFAIGITMMILSNPMQRSDETGRLLFVNTNPYCTDDNIIIFLFMMYMPLALCIVPYFALRNITNVFSFKNSLVLFVGMIAIVVICLKLGVHQYEVPLVGIAVSGLGIFSSFTRKLEILAKILGY